jgi:hypothetical protein
LAICSGEHFFGSLTFFSGFVQPQSHNKHTPIKKYPDWSINLLSLLLSQVKTTYFKKEGLFRKVIKNVS